MKNIKILVCCHKDTPRLENSIFKPILLGSQYANQELRDCFQNNFWDSTGDNIGYLHPYCAELTAIYWAWKNYEKLGNPEYIGLFHYRRFLNFGARISETDPWKCAFFDFGKETCQKYGWHEKQVQKFCEGSDLILPDQEQILDPHDWVTPTTLEMHYKHAHYPQDIDLAVSVLCREHPEYRESVKQTLNSHWGHFCNMFLMKKEFFMDYAAWLFDIIMPLKDDLHLDCAKYNGENNCQKRVLGFLCERLFNFWIDYQISNNKIKVKETQRLTGYLSATDKELFVHNYGKDTYLSLSSMKCDQAIKLNGHISLNSPSVSIVIPVYNVEPYLRECLDSLVRQTLDNIEIICVDNGSQDGSHAILCEYQKKDPRIQIIYLKENIGMPRARNLGMDAVHGKYFAFVDSDDICDRTMFEKLFLRAELLHADITTCSVWRFQGTIENKTLHRPLEWFNQSEKALPLSQRPQQLLEPAGWCKLFRTQYIKQLDYFEFRPDVLSCEDVPCITNAFIQTDRIATVQEALYYYRDRSDGNLTAKMDRRHINDFVSGMYDQMRILRNSHYEDVKVLSYIAEFKFLMAEYILSKLPTKDIAYFFKRLTALFPQKEDVYFGRLFNLYPRRKRLYFMMQKHAVVKYVISRTIYCFLRRIKHLVKQIFKISRNGVYWQCSVGPLHMRHLKRSYTEQTIQWYQNRYEKLDQSYSAAINQQSRLQTELEKTYAKCKNLTKQITEVLRKYNDSEKNLEEEKRQNQNLTKQITEARREYSDSEKNLEEEKQQNQNLQTDNNLLNQRLQQVSQLLDQKNKETYGFYYAVWNTGWVNVWKEFFYQNYHLIPEYIKELKLFLDEQSQKLVDLICYRNFKLLPFQEDSKLFLYDHNNIYTSDELNGAKIPINEEKVRTKYKFPENVQLEVPVFRFKCGMEYFSSNTLGKIKGRDIIDGGAYWGDSALVLNDYGPRSIHAFEPYSVNFEQLKQTIKLNSLSSQVIPVAAGLGLTDEERILYTEGMASGSNLFNVMPVITDTNTIQSKVKIVSIDEYVIQNNLKLGLIKLDIEGNEFAAIQGALKTIQRDRPLLSIAVYHQPQDFFKIKPILEQLGLNYKFMLRKLSYHDLVSEVVLLGYAED